MLDERLSDSSEDALAQRATPKTAADQRIGSQLCYHQWKGCRSPARQALS
jgi:hypothetical protein